MSDKPPSQNQKTDTSVQPVSTAPISAPILPVKKGRGLKIAVLIGLGALIILGIVGYLVLRTTVVFSWAPLLDRSQVWDATLDLEKEHTSRLTVSLQKLSHTPLTPAEVQIQKQELAHLAQKNTEMNAQWKEILGQPVLSSVDRVPDVARSIERRMLTYAQESHDRLDAEQVAQDRLTRTIGIQEQIDRYLVGKTDPALAGSDITAIQSAIDAIRGSLIAISQTREQLEKDLGSPLDGLKSWVDAQWLYLDALQEFYRLRSSSLSTLKGQELIVREKEDALKKTDPYQDLDTIDRLIGTDARNTLLEYARVRKEQWSETMRWWRWASMIIHLMRS